MFHHFGPFFPHLFLGNAPQKPRLDEGLWTVVAHLGADLLHLNVSCARFDLPIECIYIYILLEFDVYIYIYV